MQAFFSATYFLECCAIAATVARTTAASEADRRLDKFLVWCVVFFAAFFSGFYILGYVNLATDLPAVNLEYSTYVGLVAVLGVCGWHAWKTPRRLTPAGSAGEMRGFVPGMSGTGSRLPQGLAILTFLIFALGGG